jgi:osmotically inducible protein OsmC
MPARSSSAVWQGTLKEGNGVMTLGSGLFDGPYTRASRFEDGKGTNPEELIAAAHAGCYSMFLSAVLSNNNYTPTRVHTTAVVHITQGPTISLIELVCEAEVPGLSEEAFAEFAAQAKAGCPVSKALAAVPEITLNATLVG